VVTSLTHHSRSVVRPGASRGDAARPERMMNVAPTAERHSLLHEMGKAARAPGTHDPTHHGESAVSPCSLYAHHLAAISHAVVAADAASALHTPRLPRER